VPLSDANFMHENTGTDGAAGTTHPVSLVGGDSTTAGNTVVVFMKSPGSTPTLAGFTNVKVNGTLYVLVKSEVAAGESSWTFTTVGTLTASWYVVELSNIDLVEPMDASAIGTGSIGTGGTLSTGTTPLNAGLSTVAFAMFGAGQTVTATWDTYTNGFEEVSDTTSVPPLAVARLFTEGSTGTFECTATLTTAGGAATSYAVMVVFRAADSPIVAPLDIFAGMEWGTHGGITSTTGTTQMFGATTLTTGGTFGTTYQVLAAAARNSAYGLRIVQSAAAGFVRVGTLTSQSGTFGFNVRVVSATGTVVVAAVVNSAGSVFAQLMYDSSATKFGVRCGSTGTVSWEAGTTALNTWRWIDKRFKSSSSTWHAEWRIETAADTYTDQAAADLTGQSILSFHSLHLGGNVSQTMTADFDDVCLSKYYVAYPLGPHEVKLLTVDPAGTPTVSGTTANFNVFTANGTLAAWNATNARNAVDEVPPTISASADGVVQNAVAATEYMEFPMSSYALGPTEYIDGVRMLAPAWGGTGTGTGTLGIRGHDGTIETTLIAASVSYDAGSPTAISTTEPYWQCAMWQSVNGWTQAELDAAVLRVGYSTDATPDMGVHAVYLEIAVGKTRTQTLFGDLATVEIDPTRLGVVSMTADAPVMGTGDTTLEYEVSGTPTTVPIAEGTSDTEQTNAVDQATVNRITLYWPPEPDPIA
jgi:hypothetical protein